MDDNKIFRIEIEATLTQKYALLGKCEELGIKIRRDHEYKPKPNAGAHLQKAKQG